MCMKTKKTYNNPSNFEKNNVARLILCDFLFIDFFKKIDLILFIYFWLRWVFVAARGLSLVVASRRYSLLWCAGFSLRWFLLLRSTGSRRAGFRSCGTWASVVWLAGSSAGSVVVTHGLSCSAACRIFTDQGSDPCPLHCQADS